MVRSSCRVFPDSLVVASGLSGSLSLRPLVAVGDFSSKGALNRVSAAAGTFTLKKLECSERAVQACIR